MKKLKSLLGGCLVVSILVLLLSCWLATLILGLPTLAMLQQGM